MITRIYKLFGFIPLWSVTRKISGPEAEEVYEEMSKRFTTELNKTLARVRGQ